MFVDHQSGKTSDRVQFQKLFAAAARREFQVVLVWALDRFVGETVAETFVNIEKLLRYGVQFVSGTEPHFCTNGPGGELMIPIRDLDRAAGAYPDFGAHQSRPGEGACHG